MAKLSPTPGRSGLSTQTLRVQNVTFEERYTKCGKKDCWCARDGQLGHGPYWYACQCLNGRWVRVYVGKTLRTDLYVNAQGNLQRPLRSGRTKQLTTQEATS